MCTWKFFFATNIIFHFPKNQHLKKIQHIEESLNITRDNMKEESKNHYTALWLVGNSTKMDLRSIRVVLNVTRGNMARQLKEVQDNLTEQVHFLCYLYLRLNEPIQLSFINETVAKWKKGKRVILDVMCYFSFLGKER